MRVSSLGVKIASDLENLQTVFLQALATGKGVYQDNKNVLRDLYVWKHYDQAIKDVKKLLKSLENFDAAIFDLRNAARFLIVDEPDEEIVEATEKPFYTDLTVLQMLKSWSRDFAWTKSVLHELISEDNTAELDSDMVDGVVKDIVRRLDTILREKDVLEKRLNKYLLQLEQFVDEGSEEEEV